MIDIELNNSCPISSAMQILGGKWKIIILSRLMDGKLRFGELSSMIPLISGKVLGDRSVKRNGARRFGASSAVYWDSPKSRVLIDWRRHSIEKDIARFAWLVKQTQFDSSEKLNIRFNEPCLWLMENLFKCSVDLKMC